MLISGKHIRLIRQIKNIKQQTAARHLGISQPAYSKLEKMDKINDERLEEIFVALDCTRQEFEKLTRQLFYKVEAE